MISIVIPLYNKAPFIERALRSVLSQTLTEFECIVVDDGSTDGGAEIVASLSDSRIRLLRQPNGGVSVARNRGIQEARHHLVALLDADDEWLPDHLAESFAIYKRGKQLVASFSNFHRAPSMRLAITKISKQTTVLLDYFTFTLLNGGTGMCSSTVVARKDSLIAIGGFPPDRRIGEDLDTWMRLACAGPVAFVPKATAIYHEAKNSATKSHSPNPNLYPTFEALVRKGLIKPGLLKSARKYAAWTVLESVEHARARRNWRLCYQQLALTPESVFIQPIKAALVLGKMVLEFAGLLQLSKQVSRRLDLKRARSPDAGSKAYRA